MHLPTLLLGASLASSYARQQFGPSPEQMNYLEHINGGQNEDQDQNQGQDYGQNYGQNQDQNEGKTHGQNGEHNGNSDYNGNIDGNYDNNDDDTGAYNGYYNNAPSAQPTPIQAPVQAPDSSPIHNTFVVRPSPAVVPPAPIASSSPDVQSPALGYAYNYPSPEASKPAINSNAPVDTGALPAYQAPAPKPQAYHGSPVYAGSYEAPAQAPHQAPHHQAPQPQAPHPQAPHPQSPHPQSPQPQAPHPQAPHPKAPAPPQPKPTHAPAQEPAPAPAQEPAQEPQPGHDHGPVDNFYGHTPDSSEDLPTGPDLLPASVPSGQSDVAPVDPLQPGDNIAPVLPTKPQQFGQDEGNAFCMGTCHANPAQLKCEKPYSEPIFKSSKGCYMCCFTSGEF